MPGHSVSCMPLWSSQCGLSVCGAMTTFCMGGNGIMERLAWEGMEQGHHGRKRYKEAFGTGQNCKRKRSAWQKNQRKLHNGTFITGGNVTTNKWRNSTPSTEVNCTSQISKRRKWHYPLVKLRKILVLS
jgi:hypothetical protein